MCNGDGDEDAAGLAKNPKAQPVAEPKLPVTVRAYSAAEIEEEDGDIFGVEEDVSSGDDLDLAPSDEEDEAGAGTTATLLSKKKPTFREDPGAARQGDILLLDDIPDKPREKKNTLLQEEVRISLMGRHLGLVCFASCAAPCSSSLYVPRADVTCLPQQEVDIDEILGEVEEDEHGSLLHIDTDDKDLEALLHTKPKLQASKPSGYDFAVAHERE